MARTKHLNIVAVYTNTPWRVNDRGVEMNPRFELYNVETKEIKAKSNNPLDFDKLI